MRRRGIGGARDTLITVLRWLMKAAGMNPYRSRALTPRCQDPQGGNARARPPGSTRFAAATLPECGSPATCKERDITPSGRQRLTCTSCAHRFSKNPKFLSTKPPQ